MAKAELQEQYGLFIDGAWVPASDGAVFEAHNPATGELLAKCAEATKEDVDAAVKAAHRALESFRKTSPIERQNLLLKIADIIDENAAHLALVETMDNGKPIRETSTVDIPMAADHFRYFAGCIRADEGTARRRRPDHPVEFPLPHGGVETRSGSRRRRHHRAETLFPHLPLRT